MTIFLLSLSLSLLLLTLTASQQLQLDASAFVISASNREIRLSWNESIASQCGNLSDDKSFVNRWDMNLNIPLTDTLLAATVNDYNLSFRVIDNLVYQTRLAFDLCTFKSPYMTTLLLPQVLIKVYQDDQGTQQASLDQALVSTIDSWNLTIEGVSRFPYASPGTAFQANLEPASKYALTACFSVNSEDDCVREELFTNSVIVAEAELDSEVCYGNGKNEISFFEGSNRLFALWKMPKFSFSGYYTHLKGIISCSGINVSFDRPFGQNGCVFGIPNGDCRRIDLYATGPLQNLSVSSNLTSHGPIISGSRFRTGCEVIPQQSADFAAKSDVLVTWNPAAVLPSYAKIFLSNSSVLMEKQLTSTVGSFSFNYHWYDQPENEQVTVKLLNKDNQEIATCTLVVGSAVESSMPIETAKPVARSNSTGWIVFGVIAAIAVFVGIGYFVYRYQQSNSHSGYQVINS